MGLFGIFKEKRDIVIACPLSGEVIPAEQIEDETFAGSMLGYTVGVRPSTGEVYAPADGTISMLFDTHHAIGIETAGGVEMLIHVGIDTVGLQGAHFTPHCRAGDTVHMGDLLLEFDSAAIEAAGYRTTTAVIITNADALGAITAQTGSKAHGDPLLTIAKK